MPKHPPIGDALRKAVKDSGLTVYRIAKDAGIPQNTLHKFVVDGQGLNLRNADKLAVYFHLALQPITPSAKNKE